MRNIIVPSMDVIVRTGDVYICLTNLKTRAGHTHPEGALVRVIDQTGMTPHREITDRGYNWVCKTDFGISVWATLEACIGRGYMERHHPSLKAKRCPHCKSTLIGKGISCACGWKEANGTFM